MSWIGVCDAEQVQEDFPYSGNIDGKEIGIYLIDGEYYALEDVCPHAYALLSQGFVEDGKVECPLHEAVFDVKTGQCLHGPGGRNLNRYPVRVYDNQIQITFIEENVAWANPWTSTQRYRKAASLRHRRKAETAISISLATITI